MGISENPGGFNMRFSVPLILAILVMIAIAGCSTEDRSAIAPSIDNPAEYGISAIDSPGGTALWGMWNVTIDPGSGSIEIVPIRSSQWTVNVVKFLQPPVGPVGGVSISIVDDSLWFTDGRMLIDVSLRHPFPGMYQYTGCDVRGVFISTGNRAFEQNPALITSDNFTNPYLANPDGFTRWMNPVEFRTDGTLWTYTPGTYGIGSGYNSTLNPYKFFCDGLEPADVVYEFFGDPDNLTNRGQFKPSVLNTRRYDLYFPLDGPGGTPILNFQYAVLASWAPPDDLDPGNLPGSFPPEANTEEAFMLHAADTGTLYYTEEEAGGDLILDLEIFDWSPFLGAGDSVPSEIRRIIIESPQGILPEPWIEFDPVYINANAAPGTTDASSIVSIEISDCLPDDTEGQEVLIAIEHATETYDNYGAGTNYPDEPLTAYFMHTLSVSSLIPQGDQPVIDSIDPAHGVSDTHIYDVTATGENLSGVTMLRLVGDTEETSALNLEIIDDENLIFELDLDTLPLGFYDVIATDPVNGDGVLEDGFEVIECPCGIHDSLDEYTTDIEYNPGFASAILRTGDYAGHLVTNDGLYDWGRIAIDENPHDGTEFEYFGTKHYFMVNNNWAWAIETDPVNGLFAYASMDDPEGGIWDDGEPYEYVKLCSQDDGSYVGWINVDAGRTVAQIDFDEYGNLWVVYTDTDWSNMSYSVQRWDYDPDEPSPHFVKVATWDLSTWLNGEMVISDIVALQRYRRFYISSSKGSWPEAQRVQGWDFSTGDAVYLGYVDLTTNSPLYTNNRPDAHQRFVDMEVDRSDSILAGCRLLAMQQGDVGSTTQRTLSLAKLDVHLDSLATSTIAYSHPYVDDIFGKDRAMAFSSMCLDDINGGRIISIYYNFGVPPPGYFHVGDAPSDW